MRVAGNNIILRILSASPANFLILLPARSNCGAHAYVQNVY